MSDLHYGSIDQAEQKVDYFSEEKLQKQWLQIGLAVVCLLLAILIAFFTETLEFDFISTLSIRV